MKKHISKETLSDFFEELGEKEDLDLLTSKKLLAYRIEKSMAKKGLSKSALANAMATSRTVVHRLLDTTDTSVTLATLSKASKALGVPLFKVLR